MIARRQALKVAADRKLAEASEDGKTPSKTVTDNAAAAAKALADAEEAQATVAAAYGDEDGPTAALVAELLKTGGDDGQRWWTRLPGLTKLPRVLRTTPRRLSTN